MKSRLRPLVAGAVALVITLTGCNNPGPAPSQSSGEEYVGHVHGLGVDAADQTLYVASHGGVFRLQDGRLQLVAGRAQDTMGFTVVGPNHFLGSGHPDPTDLEQPNHLGLIESRDAATTWTPQSLAGQADFHALEQAGDALYGYDSQSGALLRTTDKKTWTPVLTTEVADLAAHPTSSGPVLALTREGLVRADRKNETALPVPAGLVQVEWPTADLLVGVTTDGGLYRSSDAGRSWVTRAQAPGQVQAFDAGPGTWHLATDEGLFSSTDQGLTWVQLL